MTAQQHGEPALEAVRLSKQYGDRPAVLGADLVVRAGEIHGLLGPNGAGKTTLLRMMLGLVRPDAGCVTMLGVRGAGGPLPPGVAGYVETAGFYPYLSGLQNLRLLARLDDARGAVEPTEVLARMGLASHAATPVRAYSAGMRQRLALAAAMLRSPRLLLIDEPTGALDPAAAIAVRHELRRLADTGVAVLLSSHDMAEVEDLCGSVTMLSHGRVVFSGSVASLREQVSGSTYFLRSSDDERARSLADGSMTVAVAPEGGLDLLARDADRDAYTVRLGVAGIAIRSLERRDATLETVFLRLTAEPAPALAPATRNRRDDSSGRGPHANARGIFAVVGVESAKLLAQPQLWVLLSLALVLPFAFALALQQSGQLPSDTLFGRWALTSGFAVPLVVLGAAPAVAFPVLASVVGADVFSSEDRHGTWATLLTRSRTMGELFTGKVLTALAVTVGTIGALGVSSVAAGVLVVGRAPLLGLSGTLLAAGPALAATATAWTSVIPPAAAFTAMAVLVSVLTRSSVAGVGLPVIVGFAMNLAALVVSTQAARHLLLTESFVAWHGLLAAPRFYGPLEQAIVISFVYVAGCLLVARAITRRRDIGS